METVADLIGSWDVLAARLDAADTASGWAEREPALACVASIADLPSQRRERSAAEQDQLLGALVRIAAVEGFDDSDAVLVVLHLLDRAARGLASSLTGASPRMLPVVVSELALQIRTFPVRRRRRAFLTSLLLDTRRGVLRECGANRFEAPFGLIRPAPGLLKQTEREPEPTEELAELFDWAQSTRVLTAGDVDLLIGLQRGTRLRLAAAEGVTERTVRRRHRRALTAIRSAVPAYLRDVA